jgi:calcineurin-like phosphoesterase family protein
MGLKRFLIFAFDPAGAAGGWRDFKGDADTREDAERIAERLHGQIQIVDTSHDENLGGSKVHLVYSLYRPFEYHDH